MRIVLVATDQHLADAWTKYMKDLDFVEVIKSSILGDQVKNNLHSGIFATGCQAIVSPANSYGFMDGGIDWLYTNRFGWGVQERIQKKIKEEYNGELLVGQAILVPTFDAEIPYVISAPTMRVPTPLSKKTVNPYLAARASLICAKKNNIDSIAFPGLGTGVGEVSPEMCALQVRQAIDDVLSGYLFPISWHDALDRHTFLYTGLKSRPENDIQEISEDDLPGVDIVDTIDELDFRGDVNAN